MKVVGFLHVAGAPMEAARRLVAEHAPWLVDVHLVDPTLLEAGDDVLMRLAARVGELIGRDVDTLVCTCPTLLADVVRVAQRAGVAAVGLDALAGTPRSSLTS